MWMLTDIPSQTVLEVLKKYKIKTVKSLIFQLKFASAIKYAGFLFHFVTVPQYIFGRICVYAIAQTEKICHQQAEL